MSDNEANSSNGSDDREERELSKRKQQISKASNKIPKMSEKDFHYPCEWGQCQSEVDLMVNFIRHVSVHVTQYIQESFGSTASSGICFSCSWRECGAQILGSEVDFNRHVYFHVFHVRIKCLGAHVSRMLNLSPCQLGPQSRNWIPELPENLECSWSDCGIIYDNPYIFYSHVCHHAEMYPEGKKVLCKCLWAGCDTTIRSKHKLKEHLRSHTQEKVIACPTCGGLFCSRTKLTDHILRQANGDLLRYECSHCSRRFTTERMLREHMRRHVNHYKCPLCEMTCPTPSALRQHARYKHSEEKPYKCGHCDFSAKSSTDLRRHLDSHNVEDQYRCHINDCNFSARAYCSLALHYKKQHQGVEENARYQCHVCEKTFARGFRLTFHLKKKHMFQWPPGHSRFRYKLHSDGFFRLQTVRYESLEVTEPSVEDDSNENSVSSSSSASNANNNNSAKTNTLASSTAHPLTTVATPLLNQIVNDSTPPVREPLNVPKLDLHTQMGIVISQEPLDLSLHGTSMKSKVTHGDRTGSEHPCKNTSRKKRAKRASSRTSKESLPVAQDQVIPELQQVAVSGEGITVSYVTVAKQQMEDSGDSIAIYMSPGVGGCSGIFEGQGRVVGMGLEGAVGGFQEYQVQLGDYQEAADANLHMLGDVALTAPKDLTSVTVLDPL